MTLTACSELLRICVVTVVLMMMEVLDAVASDLTKCVLVNMPFTVFPSREMARKHRIESLAPTVSCSGATVLE